MQKAKSKNNPIEQNMAEIYKNAVAYDKVLNDW
jgi:hypothetical protein